MSDIGVEEEEEEIDNEERATRLQLHPSRQRALFDPRARSPFFPGTPRAPAVGFENEGRDRGPLKAALRRRWLFSLVAFALVGCLLATALLGRSVSRLGFQLRQARHQLSEMAQASRRLDAGLVSLGGRVGGLETQANAQSDPAALASRVDPSVFTVEAGTTQGSAFVVRSAGGSSALVTNFHVVAEVWKSGGRSVKVRQGDRALDVSIVKASEGEDLALLQAPTGLPALAVSTSLPRVGEPILVAGSPLGYSGTVATGIVSALRDAPSDHYIQFSAPISPGNSGGPVVDREAKVVGVSVMKVVGDGAEGLSFAIPASEVCSALGVC